MRGKRYSVNGFEREAVTCTMFLLSKVWVFVKKLCQKMDQNFVNLEDAITDVVLPVVVEPCKAPVEVDVFNCLVSGYSRLLSRGILTMNNDGQTEPLLAEHSDGWNAIESAAFLSNELLKLDGWQNHPLESTPGRVIICACLSLSIKNSLDCYAFSSLKESVFWDTPIAVVYHVIFENPLTSWDKIEASSYYLEQALEQAEGRVLTIAFRRFDLFRLLNSTPTSELESALLSFIGLEEFNESKTVILILRNRCNELVLNVLCSDSNEMRAVVLSQPSKLTRALAMVVGTGLVSPKIHKWLQAASEEEIELSEKLQHFYSHSS